MAKRRSYPLAFRQQMVDLVRAGRSPEELAKEFEPSEQTIRNWVKQAELDTGRRSDGVTTQEKEELQRLRRENKQLRVEREILGKSRGLVRTGDRCRAPEIFTFVRAHQAEYSIATMCRVLEVSTSGYYEWLKRTPSAHARRDDQLSKQIGEIHDDSRRTYGVPRVHAELKADGTRVARKRIARLMRETGRQGASRRSKTFTTQRDGDARPAPDLVDRKFVATGPDQLWVADITYVPTWAGFLYLAVVLDVWSRRIVGWAMANHLRTELVLDALNMAVSQRRPAAVIHHSDQGCQYTSIGFGLRCREAGVRPSMGSVGDCYDNAMCESFFATLECELLADRRFRTQAEAEMAVFEFIEGWYNPRRRHSALGYLSPANFERAHEEAVA
ncbi:MAG TPA: IS3 family transposase [Longimicrobiales bacterium]|nr:IS3 family transposase [Longimicrobiales bacterium]